MRKGIKILGSVASTLVLVALAVPLTLALLLSIPSVQNFAANEAARVASRKLGTRVTLGHIELGFFNRVRIRSFYVEDYEGDTLLYAGQIDARLEGLRGLQLARVEVVDGELNLHQMPDGEMNIKKVTEHLRSQNPKGNFRMGIGRIALHDFRFGLRRNERSERPGAVDFSDLGIAQTTLLAHGFTIRHDTISLALDRLSFRERQSGLTVEMLSAARIDVWNGHLGFDSLRLLTPGSSMRFPRLELDAPSWSGYRDFATGVVLHVEAAGRLALPTVAYFAPALAGVEVTFSEVALDAAGTLADLTARRIVLRTEGGAVLSAPFRIVGLPDFARARIALDRLRLDTPGDEAIRLTEAFTRKPLAPGSVAMLRRAGPIGLEARFDGSTDRFRLAAQLTTAVGMARADLKAQPAPGERRRLQGELAAERFDVGALLAQSALGPLTASVRVDGTVARGEVSGDVEGRIPSIVLNGYDTRDVQFNGRVDNRRFNGYAGARDPNLQFDFNGLVDFNRKTPAYNFDLQLHRANLSRLGLNRRDSVSLLQANLVAHASGRSLDDLNGSLTVLDATYIDPADTVRARDVRLTGTNSPESKYLALRSSFADVTFRSRMSYRTTLDYLREEMHHYLPTLEASPEHMARHEAPAADNAADYSLLSVQIKQTAHLTEALVPGLRIADSTALTLMFNPSTERFSLQASSAYIEHARTLATAINLSAHNQSDSLSVYLRAADLYAGTFYLPNLSLVAGARENRIRVSAGFNDTTSHFSALLGATAVVRQDPETGARQIAVRINPSSIRRGRQTWEIFSRGILYDTTALRINRFTVQNGDEQLQLDGVASRHRTDSLTLTLRRFELAPFTQIVARMGYRIDGRLNGRAVMRSAMHKGEVTADIALDSLQVNGLHAPPLHLSSRWDMEQQRAQLYIADRAKGDTVLRGYYAPQRGRYLVDARLAGLPLRLVDPVLKGVVSSTGGSADATLRLEGMRSQATLAGQIDVRDFATTIDFTQVRYTMPQATIRVADNRLRLERATLYDPDGNTGTFDFALDVSHLSNIAFSASVAPQRMLVLKTTQADNNLFYGTVYATGNATVRGNKMGVEMDITATTERNSTFFMPLNGSSDIAQADFVVFESPRQARPDSSNYLVRRRMMFEKRQRQVVSTGGNMEVRLALNVRPDLEFQLMIDPTVGDVIKGRGEGTLNIRVNPRTNLFTMYGDYTISEGSYQFSLQNIISKRFVIEDGSSIQWTGEPLDALLNITAIYNLKTSLQPLLGADNASTRTVPVECIIHLADRLSKPAISFDVRVPGATPETSNQVANALNTQEMIATQFFYLLAFNTFYSEGGTGGQNLNIGAVGTAATGFELLSNMVSNWLSSDDYNLVIRYRPSNELSSDELDVGFSSNLANNRLFLEVEGNYVVDASKTAATNNVSNFMGEAYLTWFIDRSGNLRLRAFTHTIDRFDENQGLQESGIGIVYREDFNTFRDIVRNFKERFANFGRRKRARKATRAAEQQAREAAAGTRSVPDPADPAPLAPVTVPAPPPM